MHRRGGEDIIKYRYLAHGMTKNHMGAEDGGGNMALTRTETRTHRFPGPSTLVPPPVVLTRCDPHDQEKWRSGHCGVWVEPFQILDRLGELASLNPQP